MGPWRRDQELLCLIRGTSVFNSLLKVRIPGLWCGLCHLMATRLFTNGSLSVDAQLDCWPPASTNTWAWMSYRQFDWRIFTTELFLPSHTHLSPHLLHLISTTDPNAGPKSQTPSWLLFPEESRGPLGSAFRRIHSLPLRLGLLNQRQRASIWSSTLLL